MRRALLILFYILPLLFLGYSVFTSGYMYSLDNDELFHSHYPYLLYNGLVPFRDLYVGVYTPIFAWFLLPFELIKGFVFESVLLLRVVMIGVFVIRIGFIVAIIRRLFNHTAGWWFVPIFLFDPFTVFSGMQIRPDNLMLLLFTIGLYVLLVGLERRSVRQVGASGILFAVSALTLMKIIPSLLVIAVLLIIYLGTKKRMRQLLVALILGGLIPVTLFALYLIASGAIGQATAQMFMDIRSAYSGFRSSIYFGNFLWPNNMFVYGANGTPVTWIYAWVFMLLGFVGMYSVGSGVIKEGRFGLPEVGKLMLLGCMLVHFVSLFFVKAVFLQYYLPLHWLYALFIAVLLVDLQKDLHKIVPLKAMSTVMLGAVYIYLVYAIVPLHLSRSAVNWVGQEKTILSRWRELPVDAPVFPHYLFRPSGNFLFLPYFNGVWEVPGPAVIARYPALSQALEKTKVPRLILSGWDLGLLGSDAASYVKNNYSLVSAADTLWLRN